MRQVIMSACVETSECPYLTSKNRRSTSEKSQLKKYSPELRRRILSIEAK